MIRMKIAVGFVVAAATLGACSKKAAPTTPKDTATTETKPKQTADKQTQAPAKVDQDQKVSPGLAISADIAAACGIKAIENPNPTFDYDKEDLSPDDRKILDQIATCLTTGALKGKNVSLIGRADPRGTDEYNLGLGSRRAETVNAYLTRSGVTATQLAVTTRGALDATGTDEAGWQKDRRVDIQLRVDTEAKAE